MRRGILIDPSTASTSSLCIWRMYVCMYKASLYDTPEYIKNAVNLSLEFSPAIEVGSSCFFLQKPKN